LTASAVARVGEALTGLLRTSRFFERLPLNSQPKTTAAFAGELAAGRGRYLRTTTLARGPLDTGARSRLVATVLKHKVCPSLAELTVGRGVWTDEHGQEFDVLESDGDDDGEYDGGGGGEGGDGGGRGAPHRGKPVSRRKKSWWEGRHVCSLCGCTPTPCAVPFACDLWLLCNQHKQSFHHDACAELHAASATASTFTPQAGWEENKDPPTTRGLRLNPLVKGSASPSTRAELCWLLELRPWHCRLFEHRQAKGG